MRYERDFDERIAVFTPRQMDAIRVLDSGLCKFLLYGGALAGGKSYLLRWYALRRLMELGARGHKNVSAMLACENYPALQNRQLCKIEDEFPSWLGKYHTAHGTHGRCFILHPKYGGGRLLFRNLDDPEKYKSAEYALILVDELTLNPFEIFEGLRKRLRWPGLPDIECQFVGATNPTGIGMGWVKQLWIDRKLPKNFKYPVDYSGQFYFVQALAKDNPYVDAEYESQMSTYSDEQKAALRDGRWDIFEGQAFPEVTLETHGLGKITPADIPGNYQLYMTFDYGYGAPFSVGWWYADGDGRLVRFSEWYGWNGTPNKGLSLPDREIAQGILAREEEMGIQGRDIYRLAGHDCGSKRANPYGTVKGKSVVEGFAEEGVYLNIADPDRIVGARQFRQRIKTKIGGMPMLMAAAECEQFFRTIPRLITRSSNVKGGLEDIEEGRHVEDHIYDETRMICTFCRMPEPEDQFEETQEVGPAWKNQKLRALFPEKEMETYDFFEIGL